MYAQLDGQAKPIYPGRSLKRHLSEAKIIYWSIPTIDKWATLFQLYLSGQWLSQIPIQWLAITTDVLLFINSFASSIDASSPDFPSYDFLISPFSIIKSLSDIWITTFLFPQELVPIFHAFHYDLKSSTTTENHHVVVGKKLTNKSSYVLNYHSVSHQYSME